MTTTPVYRYKNISSTRQIIIGVGEVEPNAIIETQVLITNANFELLTQDDRKIGVDEVTKSKKK